MDKLYTNISKLLKPSVRLIEHTLLTQNEVGKENTILWDNRPSLIDSSTYSEFKDAIKKRSSKYYMFNHVLSYTDFCIGLLCSSDYSLNHKTTVSIPERTYTAAWRAIDVICATGTDKVSSWLKKFISERSSIGYCNSLGVILDIQTVPMQSQISSREISITRESKLISEISKIDKVTVINHKSDTINVSNEGNNISESNIFDTSLTPEGQLYDLVVEHCIFNNKLF